MEQLFKCETIKQRKIMEWLVAQGVTGEDVAEAALTGSAMVRVTTPAGQQMNLYCDAAYDVRILNVSQEREEELSWCCMNETSEPDTQEWREDLTGDETVMVEQWDEQYARGFAGLAQAILDLEDGHQDAPGQAPRMRF